MASKLLVIDDWMARLNRWILPLGSSHWELRANWITRSNLSIRILHTNNFLPRLVCHSLLLVAAGSTRLGWYSHIVRLWAHINLQDWPRVCRDTLRANDIIWFTAALAAENLSGQRSRRHQRRKIILSSRSRRLSSLARPRSECPTDWLAAKTAGSDPLKDSTMIVVDVESLFSRSFSLPGSRSEPLTAELGARVSRR